MTIQEIQEKFNFGEFRFPRKGEWFMTNNLFERNAAPRYDVVQARANWRHIAVQILTEK